MKKQPKSSFNQISTDGIWGTLFQVPVLYINISNVLKTLVIFIMMSTRTVGVGSIIFVFGVVGPLIFFLLIFLEKKNFIEPEIARRIGADSIHYQKLSQVSLCLNVFSGISNHQSLFDFTCLPNYFCCGITELQKSIKA